LPFDEPPSLESDRLPATDCAGGQRRRHHSIE
jgi:hypothetical protein